MSNRGNSWEYAGMPLEYWDSDAMYCDPPIAVYVAVVDGGLLATLGAVACVFTPNGFADLKKECVRCFKARGMEGWIEFHPEVPCNASKFYGWEKIV